jgi:AcrR family transcriptional regulator
MASSQPAAERRGAAGLLERGVEPPADVPPEIFQAALERFLACRRLDMRAIAAELGIGRATLYRRVGGRDHLLGAVIWFLTSHAMTRALRAGEGLTGRERVQALVGAFMRDVQGQPALRRLLDAEPEAALRILTSKHGPVQQGLIEVVAALLEEEEARGALRLTIDAATLSYVIVRVGESFLYADAIADNDPDVDLAVEVVGRLLH